ncbi:SRPBCC domain-containing protein [Actinoplanes sp. TBRC 11911]|uniref:SRPBCC family protein n=1 Tax=Actinoplanes sp. TBRC 11911 TaxID=2729386 RepID=UPI00145E7CA3|nr:SRPBCC domain-containing protein [Actinoplanes sp. TBRC 11911]NMO55531.1 SRPBCC domain-containing protein [Actinoplanes sp. TBRC 11911]
MTELVLSRVFDAPRPMVFRAFVDPEQLAAWFGPVGWHVPRESVEIEPKPGGVQRFTMVNDDDPSMTSPVNATFVEVVENELIIGEEPFGDLVMRVRIEFHDEEGGRTLLKITQGPYSTEMESNAREGWNSSFTKLDAVLAGS